MLRTMCEDRGARFFVPEQKYLGDNGAMIAYTGKLMLESGVSLPVDASQINPTFRSDEVDVTWKHETPPHSGLPAGHEATQKRGAEAVITVTGTTAEKHRISKRYRVPALDRQLIAERTRAEARLIMAARKSGVPTPVMSDITADTIRMEYVEGTLLTDNLSETTVQEAGRMVGKLHTAGITHGDLTTSNLILRKSDGRCVLIDFGLSQVTPEIEQRGVDIHVFFQTLESTAPEQAELLTTAFIAGYKETFDGAADVIRREHEIGLRGRYL
jgi:N6-L-threonylcarbamoyladenine synthase/protein kinase Bud32